MPASPAYPPELIARARRIRLACFDVDGTLTDGRLLCDAGGGEIKVFHVHDGQGLVLLRKAGIAVAFVTARRSAAVERRAAELGLQAHCGILDKLACVDAIAAELGIGRAAIAFMGDDLPDRAPMRVAGLAVAPANAHAWTATLAHWQTSRAGGDGAARELCDLILTAQDHLPALLDGMADGRRA